ncbi:septal ring lytic transglycosylase RlpA family protein [Halomonas sp. McH1-25]|uniref:septal ring lytic transglycosylase RlpA family protein n=1 Tax=unclassified Halomonas TaxID=2609666 RepID=UPI001EF4F1B7|nr:MULTISPECIES: septal ring lytic transglycosylase RlpA family protein [unclassified Halomonas]MCG7599101.1 septal ring lytic transglycosylase RlpA family protein [Halomonas sp. McH1-25]MCP1342342.1 septal ring lytic transglycosylase RlpA family protein [Halomonas sp. FL8]MCP1360404.1 septal ring lytic transglycosylase RlpA family protein [Halomonas sp. BBD45]MCP1364558.1 septal ring lytic transglycosylase RlpA family protein [Halomonas sp. BBD48]
MSSRWLGLAVSVALLAGCAGGGGGYQSGQGDEAKSSGGGRYAMDRDAYPDLPPDVSNVPDAVPRVEPLARSGNRPSYEVWGKTYHVLPSADGYEKRGRASWYGEKFHGYATASGEIYDMYKMSAAHRSLPLPTYARVTNVDNDRSVIVKVNDRGPFHDDRLIDLSYAAAARLDILRNGTGHVRVEAIDPVAWQAAHQQRQPAPSSSAPALAQAAPAKAGSPSGGSRTGTGGAVGSSPPASVAASGSAQAVDAASQSAVDTPAAASGRQIYLQVAALGSAANAQALRDRLQNELDSPVRVDSDERLHRVQVGPVRDSQELEALRSELRRVGYAQSFTITSSD